MTHSEILFYLHVSIAILVLIVLYHTIFIVVRIRNVTKKIDTVSTHIEKTVMQPLAIIEQFAQGAHMFFAKKTAKKAKK